MTIIIPYKDKGTQELHWTLRCIDKFLPGCEVRVIGEPFIHHTPQFEITDRYDDTTSKLLQECKNPNNSDEIIWMNDDQFLLKEPNFQQVVTGETLKEYINKFEDYTIYKSLINRTKNVLTRNGKQAVVYAGHRPLKCNRQKMKWLIENIYIPRGRSLALINLYNNWYGIGGIKGRDAKNPSLDEARDFDVISTSDDTYRKYLDIVKEKLNA